MTELTKKSCYLLQLVHGGQVLTRPSGTVISFS